MVSQPTIIRQHAIQAFLVLEESSKIFLHIFIRVFVPNEQIYLIAMLGILNINYQFVSYLISLFSL